MKIKTNKSKKQRNYSRLKETSYRGTTTKLIEREKTAIIDITGKIRINLNMDCILT